ncbi:hypothetical protein RhiirC2_869453 [Rhizophagus irregularis]|uniref:Uncharacterized protein n=1 Tax=Rhizophagus irregularis TaxID=588596 RepID=A0A2N1MR25_9GLOM|nr:hypothetical protein RhiirC2_869453 [Rhizophagus irregularis]
MTKSPPSSKTTMDLYIRHHSTPDSLVNNGQGDSFPVLWGGSFGLFGVWTRNFGVGFDFFFLLGFGGSFVFFFRFQRFFFFEILTSFRPSDTWDSTVLLLFGRGTLVGILFFFNFFIPSFKNGYLFPFLVQEAFWSPGRDISHFFESLWMCKISLCMTWTMVGHWTRGILYFINDCIEVAMRNNVYLGETIEVRKSYFGIWGFINGIGV